MSCQRCEVSSAAAAPSRIGAAIREERPALVVMGTHGHHGVDRILLGSVAEVTVRSSTVPVLTVSADQAHP